MELEQGRETKVSRLTELIARVKAKDQALGEELDREFKMLASHRAFGLNFERHRPESVELPGRPIRKGDKVRILPPRGSTAKGDPHLWKVLCIEVSEGQTSGPRLFAGCDRPRDKGCGRRRSWSSWLSSVTTSIRVSSPLERLSVEADKPYHTVINGENFHVH